MKRMSKLVAMLLAMVMVFSMLPLSALATEPAETPTEDPAATESATETTVASAETTEAATVETTTEEPTVETTEAPTEEPTVEATEAPAEEPTEDPNAGIDIASLVMGTKPADGTTSGNPFPKGTAGSTSFRIPALVTLSDGTLVAAADARWNTTYDGGGLDTIVARSSDNGTTWTYTFANYLGDNGNTYNGSGSTCFIDPALAVTSNDTIYMLCDLYPYGIALNGDSTQTAPGYATGFNSDGYLNLTKDGDSTAYYLKDGKICYLSDGVEYTVDTYTVDAYFNIFGNDDGIVTNLFYSDSPYKVDRTGFLYLTKSTDKGATWSAPMLIPGIKTASEQVCLVGPGRGLVTSEGMIVFPVYSYSGGTSTQKLSFIYSYDGSTWNRSNSFTGASWSSESAVVELANGTLRFFYRNGTANLCYVDYSNGAWGSYVNTGIATNSNTQISAITYSGKVDGKQVILVSCPAGPEGGSSLSGAEYRTNGKIFVGQVNADNTMTWSNTVSVPSVNSSNSFMYSCLAELNNGGVAILYEDLQSAWGNGYYTMSFKTFSTDDLGLTSTTDPEVPEVTEPVTVTDETTGVAVTAPGLTGLTVSNVTETVTFDVSGYMLIAAWDISPVGIESGDVTIPTGLAAGNKVAVFDDKFEKIGTYTVAEDGTVTFTAPHFSIYYAGKEVPVTNHTVDVELDISATSTASKTYTDDSANYTTYDVTTAGIVNVTLRGEAGKEATTTYTQASVSCNTLISSNSTSWKETSYYYTPDNENYYPLYAKRTRTSSGWFNYTYTYTWGYSTTGSSDSVTEIGEQSTNNTSNTANITVYTKTGEEAVAPQTTITFTGVAVGTTSVVVGDTTYQITVYGPQEITVNYQADGVTVKTETITVSSKDTSATLPSAITVGSDTYTVDSTTLALASGVTAYNVPVTKLDGYPITLVVSDSKTVSLTDPYGDASLSIPEAALSKGQYVKWTTSAPDKAGVAVFSDTPQGSAVIVGREATDEGKYAVITATVYDAVDAKVAAYNWLVTVTPKTTSGSGTRTIKIDVDLLEHCKVYYSINGGELIEVTEADVVIDTTIYAPDVFNIMFFAAPEEGYALTYMNGTGTDGQYYTMTNGNTDGTGSDAWPFASETASTIPSSGSDSAWKSGHGFRWALIEGNFSIPQLKMMFTEAIARGCDGASTITFNNTNNGSSKSTTFSFAAQKLPEMEKEIVSITHEGVTTPYEAGMQVEIGDTINYSITVYQPTANTSYGTISYSNVSLKDPLTELEKTSWTSGATAGSSASYTVNGYTFNASPYVHNTSLTLTNANFSEVVDHGHISNTASLEYAYQSNYSSGALSSSSSAVAEVTVTLPTYIIDFGLPVEIDLSTIAQAMGNITSVTDAAYGTATVANNKVTYTPNAVLAGADHLTLVLGNGGSYGITIIPATTVFYEEGFASYGSTWDVTGTGSWQNTSNKGTGTQTAIVAGEANGNNYGYDSVYDSMTNTSAVGGTKGDSLKFSFVGTGVDLFANCDSLTGMVCVSITDANGNYVRSLIINAKPNGLYAGGLTVAYNTPIVSVNGLTHGKYDVVVYVATGTFKFDGFRIYNTIDTSNNSEVLDYYTSDLEENPTFYELRDAVLAGLQVADSEDYAQAQGSQAYGKLFGEEVSATNGAVVLGTGETEQELLDFGPKNELYLAPGQSVTFKLNTTRQAQIGLRVVNGVSTSYTVNGGTAKTISSNVDMFYDLHARGASAATYTIKNTGDGILSITQIKVSDNVDGLFGELTEEDIIAALIAMGVPSEPDPFVPVITMYWVSKVVRAGQTNILTIVTSDDVDTLSVDGRLLHSYTIRGLKIWNFSVRAQKAGSCIYKVVATNAEGVAAETVMTPSFTVLPAKTWGIGRFF